MSAQEPLYQPGAELPRPQTEAANQSMAGEPDSTRRSAEVAGQAAELPGTAQQASNGPADNTGPSLPTTPPPMPQNTPTGVPTTPVTPTSNPSMANDSDLIEQEWVEKAKAIVENTKNDPYLQNKQLNQFKADYLKKRYNKEIKVDVDKQ